MSTEKVKVLSLTEKVSIIHRYGACSKTALTRIDENGTIRRILLEKEKILEQYKAMNTKIVAALNVPHSNYASCLQAKIAILEKVLIEWYLRAEAKKKLSHHQLIRYIVAEKVERAAQILSMHFSVTRFMPWMKRLARNCLKAFANQTTRRLDTASCSLKIILRFVLARDGISQDQARTLYGLRIENYEKQETIPMLDRLYSCNKEDYPPKHKTYIRSVGKNEEKTEEEEVSSSDNDDMQPTVRPILNYENEEIACKSGKQNDVYNSGNNGKKSCGTTIKFEVKSETPDADSDAPDASSANEDMQPKVWPIKDECKSEDEIYFISDEDESEIPDATFSNNHWIVNNDCETTKGEDDLECTYELFEVINVDNEDAFDASTSPNDILPVSLIKSEYPVAVDNGEEVTNNFLPNLEKNVIKIESDEYEIQISE